MHFIKQGIIENISRQEQNQQINVPRDSTRWTNNRMIIESNEQNVKSKVRQWGTKSWFKSIKNKRPKTKQTGLKCKSTETRIRGAKKFSEKNFFTQNKIKRIWSLWFETKNKNWKMVSNFDVQFTEQQTDFLKEEKNKKTKKQTNKKTIKIHKCQNHNCENWPKTVTMTQKNKTQTMSFQHKEKNTQKETWKRMERIVIQNHCFQKTKTKQEEG